MRKSILLYLFKGPVLLYRKVLSPLLGPSCRFYPTCSAYALEALDRHGAIKGAALAVRRFLSCHPWFCGQFYDPVPKTFTWRGVIGYNRSAAGHEKRPDECCGLHEKVKHNEDV